MYSPFGKPELQTKYEESLRKWTPTQRYPKYQTAALDGVRQAAVGLILRERDGVLSDFILTLRSPHLREHAGQVALPGGLLEENEKSDPILALEREVSEEISIPQNSIEWFPRPWDPVFSIFGIHVLPYWGVLKAEQRDVPLTPDPLEVSRAEWIPFRHLFDESKWTEREYSRRNADGSPTSEKMPVFTAWEVETWGLTAVVLSLFVRRISGRSPY